MGRGPSKQYHKQMAEGYVVGTLTCLNAETVKEHASPDFPLVLNIEPTNVCNLKCYLCAGQQKAKRPKGFMPMPLFRNIIDECSEYPQLHMLNLHKDGEPFLHPNIIEMIGYAKRSNCAKTLHINTNGTFDVEKIDDILDSGVDDITISIDAYTGGTYEKIKGCNIYDTVLLNTLMLLHRKKALGLTWPRIRVKIMEYTDTASEVEDFVRFWQDKADEVQVTGVHNWSGAIDGLIVTDELGVRTSRWPCILLWYTLAVNWDGQVSICNLDWDLSGAVGNLFFNSSIQSIWRGQRMKEIRRAALEGRHNIAGVCDKCVVWAGGQDIAEWLKEQKEFL